VLFYHLSLVYFQDSVYIFHKQTTGLKSKHTYEEENDFISS